LTTGLANGDDMGWIDAPTTRVDVDGVDLAVTVTGDGPPVLLLHGYPQTRAMWHAVAPALAEGHTLVAPDLRGYGDSSKPVGDRYDKRAMAADQLGVMEALGFDRFAVVGHDRGGRVGHRLALDHPAAVSAVAVLDIVPTLHMFEHVDRAMAEAYFHWFFLTRADGLPEALISAAPDAWLESRFRGRSAAPGAIDPAAAAEYRRCFTAEMIAASTADYRAASTVDLDHDRVDRAAGRTVEVPMLALWGSASYVGRTFDVVDAWRPFAPRVTGRAILADHYLAEEAPDAVAAALLDFLAMGDAE
jgi:haloacetate dehalogenase